MADNDDEARNGLSQLTDEQPEFDALSSVIRAMQPLSRDARLRVLGAVSTFFGMSAPQDAIQSVRGPTRADSTASDVGSERFSKDRTPGPKEFLFEKRPQTDVERVACLAYYLTHYREAPLFKTLDLGKLNTEAAQLKFSNAAYAVDNAAKAGFLVPASKGQKQLSALGELYVQALPNREAAREAVAQVRPRKRTRRGVKGIPADTAVDEGSE